MSAICERKEKGITRNIRHTYHLGSVLFSIRLHYLPYGILIRKNRTLRIEKHSVHLQSNRLIKVMEKEIELIRMSSTEIMEKVAAYKDEQIIILNQVNKVSEAEQYSPIRADFFWLSYACEEKRLYLSTTILMKSVGMI